MSLGLMMIVKDEEHVIERCLRSVLPHVDWWLVIDTGSSDRTREVVREVMGDLPGDLLERPWVNFGHNRTELFREAAALHPGDYALALDADEVLEDLRDLRAFDRTEVVDGKAQTVRRVPSILPADHTRPDAYSLTVLYAGTTYHDVSIFNLASPWHWVGAAHEYPDLSEGVLVVPHLNGARIVQYHEGARAQNEEASIQWDISRLTESLTEDPANPRWQFYLAQSYRDIGNLEYAIERYQIRADNASGWADERWHSLYQIGHLLQRLGRDPRGAFLDAYEFDTSRAEPLVELAAVERLAGRNALARLYAAAACVVDYPSATALFVEQAAYSWRRWDELSVSSYWTGDYHTALDAAERALTANPDDPRLRDNLDHCRKALA